MKKKLILVILFTMLCACSTSDGSFQKGDIQYDTLFDNINKKIQREDWDIAVLNDQALTAQDVESQFHLDMTKIDSFMIKRSLLALEPGEIAIFKVSQEYDEEIENALQQHKMDIVTENTFISNIEELLEQSQMGRLGEYYYFILGHDSEKVVHYMQEY